MRVWFTVILSAIAFAGLFAQSAHKHKRNGDLMYDQGEYMVAEEAYRRANSREESADATYNLGNAIFQQERYDEAVRYFEQAAEMAGDDNLKADALFNLGNTHMQAQQLDKGVQSYIESLKLDPNDLETKKNLTLALQQLKEQQQQQQQQQQEQDEEEEEQEQEEQQEQQQQQQSQQEEQEEQQAQPQPEDLTKEEAEELLRIADAEDQKVQEKLKKASDKPRKTKKDW